MSLTDSQQATQDLLRMWLLGTLAVAPPVDAAVSTGASSGTPAFTADITVDNTAGGVQLLASNANRVSAIIQNTGADNIRVAIGTNPTTTTGIQLAAGASILLTQPFCPTGQVKGIREGASNSTVCAVEVT